MAMRPHAFDKNHITEHFVTEDPSSQHEGHHRPTMSAESASSSDNDIESISTDGHIGRVTNSSSHCDEG